MSEEILPPVHGNTTRGVRPANNERRNERRYVTMPWNKGYSERIEVCESVARQLSEEARRRLARFIEPAHTDSAVTK